MQIPSNDYIEPEGYVELEGENYLVKRLKKIKLKGRTYFDIELDHLMTELNDYTVEAFEYNSVSAETALTNLLADTTWSVGDVDNLGTENMDSDRRITVLRGITLLLETFGGEVYFNQDRTVDIKSTIGDDTKKVQIRYDKNSDYIEKEEDQSKIVTRLYPYGNDNITINTQIMEECDVLADWTTSDETNLVKSADTVDRKHGQASLKLIAAATDSLNDTLTRDLGAGSELDLTDHTKLKYWIKSSRTGTNLKFGMGESAWDDNTYNVTIDTANEWQEEEWDISGIANANKNAIRYIGLKIANADALNTIRFDYIRAFDGEIYLESANIDDYKNPKEVALFTTFDDVDELKAYAQEYLDQYDSPIERYLVNMADLSKAMKDTWSDDSIALGDTVRVYDSDLGLNVDCRVKKITKDLLNHTLMSIELTNSLENISKKLVDDYRRLSSAMPYDNDKTAINAGAVKFGYLQASVIRANSIYAEHYAQLRNVLPYNFDDSLDSSYPLECEFYMPPNVDEIKSAWVHIVGRNFRAYSKGAASGGGQTSSSGGGQTTSSGSSHSHTVTGQTASSGGNHRHYVGTFSTGVGTNSHYHSILNGVTDVQAYSDHTHSVGEHYTGYSDNHIHSVTGTTSSSESSHTHTVSNHTHTVSNHTHSLTFGIYESTDPTGVNIYVDNGSGYGSSLISDDTPVSIDYNIVGELSTTAGWKKLKITSSRLGRVVVAIILDLTISSI
ncbi:MAG: phage tail spike protein [Candidatus Pacearchaeota archaeon]